MNKTKLHNKALNYKKALIRLEEASHYDVAVGLNLDGLIQRFEFTMELAWKLIKSYLEEKGDDVPIHGSKDAVRRAFSLALIEEPGIWLKMINDRNTLSHTYDEKEAFEIAGKIKAVYLPELKKLDHVLTPLITDEID